VSGWRKVGSEKSQGFEQNRDIVKLDMTPLHNSTPLSLTTMYAGCHEHLNSNLN
jgi:hypothetical protein